jgi:hypothetical protein
VRTVALHTAMAASLTVACGCDQAYHAYVELAYAPQTIYAPGFDERSFDALAVGMTMDEVLRRVGPPIREFRTQNITFVVYSDIGHYTRKSEKAYRQRWLAVNGAGRVVYIFRRTITSDEDPTDPVGGWVQDQSGVWQPTIRVPYATTSAGQR